MTSNTLSIDFHTTPINNHDFDSVRKQLVSECLAYRNAGLSFIEISELWNNRGQKTKNGKNWSPGNIHHLINNPEPTLTRKKSKDKKRSVRTIGINKNNNKNFSWITETFPQYEEWRILGSKWAHGAESGLQNVISGFNIFVEYVHKHQLSSNPIQFLLAANQYPDFYISKWGNTKTHSSVLINNTAYFFIEWVLSQPEFCEADDYGNIVTSPAFRNPIQYIRRTGIPRHPESVRTTLPYSYIEELRQMIAQGPNFCDWTWAQNAIGLAFKKSNNEDDFGEKISPIWFTVDESLIDKTDPDCVWRERTKITGSRPNGRKEYKTVFEMWSPVRWVALLIKLQLPLRTFQVRMLDSGEADTWHWENNNWTINSNTLALGTEARPYGNGVFRKPSDLSDCDSMVLLHINTNKTADIGKDGNHKGYNVPWILGGKCHQDPYYWLEKLRNWQEKYNPIHRLTRWDELDGRHLPAKSEIQLASYPDTAFLFRTPENKKSPFVPLTQTALNAPWSSCLNTLEQRLEARGERLPGGGKIQLVTRNNNYLRALYQLHGLRVSLLTVMAIDGEIPLAILQKIAGHSRLIMTLYYTKPGAAQTRAAIQAGVERLSESAGDSMMAWLANADYKQLVTEAITCSPDSFRYAVSESQEHRSSAGWMVMMDGICLAGGNTSELDSAGCHNGGPNIGSESAPRYASVPGGARNCPRCRWFVTRPSFLPHLAARWNNVMYHCNEARTAVIDAEDKFLELEELRAVSLMAGNIFTKQREFLEAERVREQAIQRFDELTMAVAAITRLIERCRVALNGKDASAIVAVGSMQDIEYVIDEAPSELLQLSGICEGTDIYPDLDPGKAVIRRSQLLDAALQREQLPPMFLFLSENEQKRVGNAFLRQLAIQMNPHSPAIGRYQVISLIDAGKSLAQHLGIDISMILDGARKPRTPKGVALTIKKN